MMVSKIPWNISVENVIILVKLVNTISQLNVPLHETRIKTKFECIFFSIFSWTTKLNKAKLSQVCFCTCLLINSYKVFTDNLPTVCTGFTLMLLFIRRPPNKDIDRIGGTANIG